MHVLLLGAGGFIGRHILTELLEQGHEVTAVVRGTGTLAHAFPQARFRALDLSLATSEADWASLCTGVDCLVNCAGLLRGKAMQAVHADMPRALYAAAAHAGVRQAILISAISARADVKTDYSQSKLAGEDVLKSSRLDWTVLRPSLVYGEGSYGGTSLIRGMAGLPLAVPLPGKGDFAFTPIHVRDLARGVVRICGDAAMAGRSLEPVGPERLSLREVLALYRGWLGFGEARFLSVPMPVMRFFARVGDLFGAGPVSTNSLAQMVAGNDGDSAAYESAIGFPQRSMAAALAASPAQVQDRWHARLYFLAPAIKAVLVLMWVASALLGLFYGSEAASALLHNLGLPQQWVPASLALGTAIDLAVAAVLLLDRKARWSTAVQLLVVLGYTAVLTIGLPQLWLEPLGPLLKNLPVLALILVHGAIGDRR
ncbi:SDR family oxidoreductase [Alteraurantiacibacter aquimixticola]|uniref:SDR family oxidoreductase n=1 Tax=Alteraurantiacibacter aquimixticola TaxID=2489173 RepID=A0A4T3F3U7_9SPHN|nr:SDR family oxidoreductase [Alteraurantiacibacter aquimixticola]TIX51913.1 SDR family oxidoreductase [Alteraurantiacibacter aquimixticola]